MAKIVPLFSSSRGNSFLLSDGGNHLLIDCGVSTKRLKLALAGQEVQPEQLSGILLTHEHTDHIAALKVYTKHYDTPLYASEGVSYALSRDRLIQGHTPLHELSVIGNEVGDFWVEHFITPHDSIGSVGFRITLPSGKTVGFATDIGIVTPSIVQGLTGCNLVVLESNYDPDMLKNGSYPYSVKRRIASMMGHLPNHEAASFAAKLVEEGTNRLILAHLSQENNLPSLAKLTIKQHFEEKGIQEDQYRLLVASPEGSTGLVF